MPNLDQWAQGLVDDVHSKWESMGHLRSVLDAGYGVFYSPIRPNPDILFVGFNPGGSAADFDENRARTIPAEHEYLTEDYPMARKMRKLFEKIGQQALLANSVKTNVIFFRTSGMYPWKSIENTSRKDIEAFCMGKVREIVDTLKPKIIIAEGIETYSYLKIILGLDGSEDPILSNGRTIFVRYNSKTPRVVGIIHPTGARVSNAEWETIQEKLNNELSFSGKHAL